MNHRQRDAKTVATNVEEGSSPRFEVVHQPTYRETSIVPHVMRGDVGDRKVALTRVESRQGFGAVMHCSSVSIIIVSNLILTGDIFLYDRKVASYWLTVINGDTCLRNTNK